VLKLGGLTVLLDCGWNEALDPKLLSPLLPHLNELDLIVVSHADIKHTGALPYLLSKYPVTCPVICTEPVCRLGELSCVAVLEDREKYQAPTEDITMDDILRTYMSRVTTLNYREPYHVQARGRTLAACPFPSGRHLGSAYWTFHCGGLSALYMVGCDMRRGRFLDGLDYERLLPSYRGVAQPWDVVITSPLPTMGAMLPQMGAQQAPQEIAVPTKAMTVARTVREQLLLEGTIATLRRGGSVLIPADVAGSVPEVLLLLDAAWEQDRQLSSNYPLVWLSSMGDMVLDQVKTRLEWMSKEVLKKFEDRLGTHPFILHNVRIFQSLEELCSVHPLSRPKVIITTSPNLEGGDSRELFMRLSGEPRTLLWLLGVPTAGSLARQLLSDFVLKHATRKEYRLQQFLKQPLSEEQLRAYYEAKIQELLESGQKLPPELAMLKAEFEDLGRPKVEDGDAPEPPPDAETAVPVGAGGDATAPSRLAASAAAAAAVAGGPTRPSAAKGHTATLWSPLGWPGSRTLAHGEARSEGDDYGHRLSTAELRLWRAQDQGSERYGLTGDGTAAEGGGEAGGGHAKDGPAKQEQDEADELADWRDNLRVHFPEPMKAEVRERTVRVGCRIRFLPDTTMEPKDLYMLLRTIAPRHVVLLPAADEFAPTGRLIAKQFRHCKTDRAPAPEIHEVRGLEDTPLQLTLRAPKRRLQFSQELWPRISFLRARDGSRVARVRAMMPAEAPSEPRALLELGAVPAAQVEAPKSEESSSEERLPRHGALFLAKGEEPLTLSSLKEQLQRAEWTRDDVEVDFRPPPARGSRPWSARLVSAANKAVLGWVGPTLGNPAPGSGGNGSDAQAGKPKASVAGANAKGAPVLRLEGVPGEEFFAARAALYRRCAII